MSIAKEEIILLGNNNITNEKCSYYLHCSGYKVSYQLDADVGNDSQYLIVFDLINPVSDIDHLLNHVTKNMSVPILVIINDDYARSDLYHKGIQDYILNPINDKEFIYRIDSGMRYFYNKGDGNDCNLAIEMNKMSGYIHNANFESAEKVLVKKTCQYLIDNIDMKFCLDGVAREMGTNRSKLSASFKLVLNNSVFEWLRKERMMLAKYYLISTRMSIQQVSLEVGYNNAANFSTLYKKCFNLSPREQRSILTVK
ncbi:AraC family transcriptional regulator [Shewanella surugensis]|uniref:AraC family transcriptional regulator n=1 Tax=Shewanella surugensis TaxID=212020 RepID=A0ABT0LEF6_9GAMM|nr:AraC family transcriptional regulator [Shewanella surugensis]MCL1126089.1 AraC family transcriptional regulator [Shewanella surugensis]